MNAIKQTENELNEHIGTLTTNDFHKPKELKVVFSICGNAICHIRSTRVLLIYLLILLENRAMAVSHACCIDRQHACGACVCLPH